MIDFIFWVIFINVIGFLSFPIAFTFFKHAGDRGYTVSKVLGLLLWGYFYWIGNTIGLLNNSRGGALSAVVVLTAVSLWFGIRNGIKKIFSWMRKNKSLIIFHEMVFLIAFLLLAIVRGANPEISGTEKPMELAFINAIFRSQNFPPNDPWLSGFSISYYYFGYLMVAGMMQLLGTISGTAFNLAIALTFALTACTSSGVLFNLLRNKEIHLGLNLSSKRVKRILLITLLAPLFILIVSNGEGFLEVLHSKGIFWNIAVDGQYTSNFWSWLDIQDLTAEPSLPLDGIPGRVGGSWWWRASRVLQDYTVSGQSREIIDEFPFFSFLLADLHPHVLAMPFVLLAVYNGFYIFQYSLEKRENHKSLFEYIRHPQIWFLAFTTGSLIFLNTWDFPIYFGLISLAFLVPVIQKNGWTKDSLWDFLRFTIPFGIVSILMYLPFLLGLSSQAGGLLPSLIYRTRAIHFLVMFFPQTILITFFIFKKVIKMKKTKVFFKMVIGGFLLLLLVFLLTLMIPALLEQVPQILTSFGGLAGIDVSVKVQNMRATNQSFFGIYGAENAGEIIIEALQKAIKYPVLVLFLLAVISAIFVLLFNRPINGKRNEESGIEQSLSKSGQYVLLLTLLGMLLVLFPEFFYLRDQFGWRMNTIFKFYFQAWILFSLGSAFVVGSISQFAERNKKVFYSLGSMILIAVGLVYPAFSIFNKTNSFKNIDWSLDGNLYFERANPEEAEAIAYLANLPFGTVVEAVGGSYSGYARVSRLSGFPTVLGWVGHEFQWRGGGVEVGSRESDIEQLYEVYDWESAKRILDKYNIDYVFISSTERNKYQVREEKFANHLTVVFNNSEVTVYAYSRDN